MEQIGRYRVIRPLAQGGMGQVFLALDPSLERQIAIKLLHKDPNHGLRREAKTLAALSHPNIVTIFEIGEHDGQDFIAMEFLPGRTLRDILTEPPLPTREEKIAIVVAVAVAVAAAHKAGILHRDIKPENVVTTPNGVKVVDFGIARRLEEKASGVSSPEDLYTVLVTPGPDAATRKFARQTVATPGTQTMFGTPAYMPPEVLGGEPSTPASDVYSLGIMLHECLAGRRPYDAGNMIETIAHIIMAPPPSLDDPLNPLLVRMLAREPADRPSLVEVIAALQPGAPPPTLEVVRPRRKRIAFALGAALLAGGSAAAVLAMRSSDGDSSKFKQAPPPAVEAKVLIAPVIVDMPTWGINRSDGNEVARTLVRALGRAEGARLDVSAVATRTLGTQLQAAQEQGVDYLIVMRLDEDSTKPELTGTVSVYDGRSGKPVTKEPRVIRGPSTQISQLQYELLDAALMTIAPTAKLPREVDRTRAQGHVTDGRAQVAAGDFDKARSDFDAAVGADPSYPDAWYGLALALGWTEAPEELVLQAAERAFELAPAGQRKELMRGVSLFFQERFTESRIALEKLEEAGATNGPDQLELLYFLGEANWHDGRHDAGHAYFKRGLAIPPRSRAFAIHQAQYLIARRLGDEARYVTGAAGFTDTNQIDFSDGRYRKLADLPSGGYRILGKMVLGEKVTDADFNTTWEPLEAGIARAGRLVEGKDLDGARALLDRLWTDHIGDKRLTPRDYHQLEYLGEVVVAGGMVAEARKLVELLARSSSTRPRRGYHRLSMLTAALAKDPALIVAGPVVSERNQQLGAAAAAEIAGDHAKAAELLGALVANPTYTWDYPERAALIRNLRAIRQPKQVEAICKDTRTPAIYRHAYPVLRGLCR